MTRSKAPIENLSHGVDSGQLASMNQHNHATSGSALSAADPNIIGGDLNSQVAATVSGSVDMGLAGKSVDELTTAVSSEMSVMGGNPFTQIGDGTLVGPGNISHKGELNVGKMTGDLSVANVGVAPQTNLKGVPKLSSHMNDGHQGH